MLYAPDVSRNDVQCVGINHAVSGASIVQRFDSYTRSGISIAHGYVVPRSQSSTFTPFTPVFPDEQNFAMCI